jgi:glutamate racemase
MRDIDLIRLIIRGRSFSLQGTAGQRCYFAGGAEQRSLVHNDRHTVQGRQRVAYNTNPDQPIGVFDSGVGGLTVLKAIRELLPHEKLVYLGDTARLPYGTKSPASVLRYALQATAHLRERGVKMVVVACNTASAVALSNLQQTLAPLPVIGVVEPGAAAAVAARPRARHLVLATEATVRLGAYGEAIRRLDAAASVRELPCELMVAQAEEGWVRGAVAEAIVSEYLRPWFRGPDAWHPQSLILGCTHFPILIDAIRSVVSDGLSITDSARTTAAVVAAQLASRQLQRDTREPGDLQLLATDGAMRFARVGGAFLGEPLVSSDIELVDL